MTRLILQLSEDKVDRAISELDSSWKAGSVTQAPGRMASQLRQEGQEDEAGPSKAPGDEAGPTEPQGDDSARSSKDEKESN